MKRQAIASALFILGIVCWGLAVFFWVEKARAADWTSTGYYQFPDQATAGALYVQLGGKLNADGSMPPDAGDGNYTLHCGIQEGNRRPGTNGPTDAGDVFTGYWCMGRLDRGYVGYSAIAAALAQYDQTTMVIGTPQAPRQAWNVYQ